MRNNGASGEPTSAWYHADGLVYARFQGAKDEIMKADWLKAGATFAPRCLAARLISLESASEAEQRDRFGLLAGDISLMPNGTLNRFNHVLDFDEGLTHVFCVGAIVFHRQCFRDVTAVLTSLSRAGISF